MGTFPTWVTRLRGVAYFSILHIASFTGAVFLLGSILPLAFLPGTYLLHRKLADIVLGMWYLLACAYMEFLLGIKFRVSGDKFVRGESSLIIMNHRTQFDWMWLWPVLYHYARLRSIKIVLKQPLKWVPGFGWALQSAGFMFLRRNWESDQDTIGLILDYYENVESPLSTLIFPEGTCLDSEGIEKSNRYADKNNKPRYKYCLHPREKGFQFLLSELKKRKLITHVHNITIGYKGEIVEDGKDMIGRGCFPEDVHFHVEKIPISDMPSGDYETGEWIRDVFKAKEQELTKFYDDDANTFDGEVLDGTYRARKIGMALSMLFWPLMTYLWIYLCRNFTLVFYHQIAMVLIYTIQPWWSGGLEFFIAVVTNLFKRTAVKQKKA